MKNFNKQLIFALIALNSILLANIAYGTPYSCLCDAEAWFKNQTRVPANTTFRIQYLNNTGEVWSECWNGTNAQFPPIPGNENKIKCDTRTCDSNNDPYYCNITVWANVNWSESTQIPPIDVSNATLIGVNGSILQQSGPTSPYLNITLTDAAYPNVTITANTTTETVEANQNASYLLNVTNFGSAEGNFNITSTTNATQAYFNDTAITNLGVNQSWYILMNVSANSDAKYTTNITVFYVPINPETNTSANDTIEVNTSVFTIVYKVSIDTNWTTANTTTEGNATYLINVTNLGNTVDTIILKNYTNATNAVLNETVITNLGIGASYFVLLSVWDTTSGWYETNITGVSANDANANDTKIVYTNVTAITYNVTITPNTTAPVNVYNDTNATYLLVINNSGNRIDNYTLTNSTNASIAKLNSTQIINLSPGETADVLLEVGDPGAGGMFQTNVTVMSENDGNSNDTATVWTNVTDINRNVSVKANTPTITTYNNTNATYIINITNTGNIADSYNITNTTNATHAWLNQTQTPNLNPGESFYITLNITDNTPGEYETNITATSQAEGTIKNMTTVNTTILEAPVRDVNITSNQTQADIWNNQYAIYRLNITNKGNQQDNFTISRTTNATTAILNQTKIINLGAGASYIIILNVTDNTKGMYKTNVTVASDNDAGAKDSTAVWTNVTEIPVYNVKITANTTYIQSYNNTNATYKLNITNMGNYPDNFTITNTTNATHAWLNQTQTPNLNPGESFYITLNITDNTPGEYETNITATSQKNKSVNDTEQVWTNITELIRSVKVETDSDYKEVSTDENATYLINITNNGTIADDYSLYNVTNGTATAVMNQTSTPVIQPGQSFFIRLDISAATVGIYQSNITAVSNTDSQVNDTQTVLTNVTNNPPTKPTVEIIPTNPTTDKDLICNITTESTDPEGEPVSYYYQWYNNSVLYLSTGNLSQTTYTLSKGNTSKGEKWNCTVTPYDGSLNGTASSDSTTIENTPPGITVNLTPKPASTIQNITCTGIFTDTDGDAPSPVYYRFSGDYTNTGTASCYAITGGYNCTANITSDNTKEADNITCEMTPNDGETNGTSDSDWIEVAWVTAPVNLRAWLNQTDRRSVILNWTGSPDATQYNIYWDTNVTKMLTLDPYYAGAPDAVTTRTNYTDMNAYTDQEKYYRVVAVKSPAFAKAPETAGKYNISIQEGPNLISVPLDQLHNDINTVIVPPPTSTNDRIVKYVPGSGFTRTDYYGPTYKWWGWFDTIDLDKGYYMYPVQKDYELPIVGLVLTENRTVHISTGLNLVGWSSVYTKNISDVLLPPNNANFEDRIIKYIPGDGFSRTDYYGTTYKWWGWWSDIRPGEGLYFYPTGASYDWEYDPDIFN